MAGSPRGSGPLLSFIEAAGIAGLDQRIISAGVKAGEIPSLKIGGRRWIPREAFNRFLAGELQTG